MLSPTQINVFSGNCPYALKLYREHRYDDRGDAEGPAAAESGIVAHACLHQAALAEKAGRPRNEAVEAIALALTKKYSAELVRAAADHALEFMFDWTFPKSFDYEHGVAFDAAWKKVDWDSPERRIRLIFDVVGVTDAQDEVYGELKVAVAEDYKTGFGVSEDDLDGPQCLAFTTALQRMFPEADAYEVRLIGTRFHKIFKRRWVKEDEDQAADLRRRENTLEFYMKACEQSDFKPRCGYGCTRCRFPSVCETFQKHVEAAQAQAVIADVNQAAADFGVLEAKMSVLESYLKAKAKEQPIELNGYVLGYHASNGTEIKDAALLGEDFAKLMDGDAKTIQMARSFATASKLGITSIKAVLESAAKKMGYPSKKACVEAELPKYVETTVKTTFCWKKNKDAPVAETAKVAAAPAQKKELF
jgi:hypothetical protein